LSVLKSLDIDLPQREKKTLFRFLALYTFFTIVVLALTVSLYYNLQKELAQRQMTIELNEYSNDFISTLQHLKSQKAGSSSYPHDPKFRSSLYGVDYKLIYSTLSNPKKLLTEVSYTNNKIIRYIINPEDYYLHTQYIVIEIVDDESWLKKTVRNLILYSFLFFTTMIIIGYFLLKTFLKPMRDAIHLLDTFIKDTTHELNTPVSTIMTNIEMINKDNIKDKYLLKIINRIEIGTKTVSNIYDDLSFLILKNKIISNNQNINLKKLIAQRVEYFSILANVKKIQIKTKLDPNATLNIDEKKISKLIDNLLSNAIKYNKINGSIVITLDKNELTIKDTGKGIEQQNIDLMFERYARFDHVVGGFGIGLNIVKMICDEYNLDIKITSQVNKFTEVSITF